MVSSVLTMQIALPAAVLPTVLVPFTEGEPTRNTVLRCTPASTIVDTLFSLGVSFSENARSNIDHISCKTTNSPTPALIDCNIYTTAKSTWRSL
jgi:hypothetical protein